MRIKFNDKIYRLKEIESGVDSLMELMEEPRYRDGDFVVGELGSILIFKKADGDCIFDHAYLPPWGELIIDKVTSCQGIRRHATTEEKQRMTEALAERGKRWNNDKKCVEDIPKRKFKAGDKVRIKDGISNKTHSDAKPCFTGIMDEFIGRALTVKEHVHGGLYVKINEDKDGFLFHEDWLEPWSDEPKKGDLAIFWDNCTSYAIIRIYDRKDNKYHSDSSDFHWKNAIKFESKEQFEKLINGEI